MMKGTETGPTRRSLELELDWNWQIHVFDPPTSPHDVDGSLTFMSPLAHLWGV